MIHIFPQSSSTLNISKAELLIKLFVGKNLGEDPTVKIEKKKKGYKNKILFNFFLYRVNMVRPSRRRGDDDLGLVTDSTGRVHGRTVTASSRGTRGRHSTSNLPAIPTPLPPAIPFRSRPPLQPHLSYTPVPYEAYESAHPGPSHPPNTVYDPYLHAPTIRPRIPYRSAIGVEFFYQMVGTTPHDSSCSTHGYSHADFGVSSSEPYIGKPVYRGEANERGDDSGDGGDDGEDEGEDASDEEQPMPAAPVAHASGSDGRPRHENRKGLLESFMSMIKKISRSRNKRPDVACEVLAPTQRRNKVKPSDWEQTGPTDGGPVDLELIPSYGGHVAGSIWRDRCISLS
ncbi:hypothetical protein M9H77_30373 [Catharanthus roseus]|uniref:Uncharacterized protein n=1 Tax=Catharanthus roseus TaxID=4058 RepID=A0ACB9ZXE9_CATRO|nr:hypothetical protein M9H77_30373 [Catharanthus roseus]